MYLQINMVNADPVITNIYENLQIVWSQFFTYMLLFVYIRSTSNIYWFIGIQIRCQQIQMNSYSVTFDYLQYLVQHSMNNPEAKKNSYLPLLRILFTNVWYGRGCSLVYYNAVSIVTVPGHWKEGSVISCTTDMGTVP